MNFQPIHNEPRRSTTDQTLPYHTTRKIIRWECGVTMMVRSHYSGEAWTKLVIFPRSLVCERIRKLRSQGTQYHSISLELLLFEFVTTAGGSGPGQPFAYPPSFVTRRKWVTLSQVGGLDI